MDQNNQTNDIEQDAKRGRPSKKLDGQKPSINSNQPQFWIQSQEATQIFIILATNAQIVFKCLSGKQKNQEIKITKQSDTKRSSSLTKYRKSRQEFVRNAEKLQNKLLKNLENHLQIELIGQQEQMNYFFFQDNKKTNFDQEPYNMMMELLRPYIHKDFYKTLIKLLELQSTFKINQSDLDDLYNIQKHKHFVSWALVIAWGKKIRAHLELLQKIRNESELTQAGLYAKQLMDKSVEIRKKKEDDVKKDISQLVKDKEKKIKKEINEIIKQFRYRNQQNNSEIKQNSYLEVD
ncbi:unnamed protein product (macronuclear) [Paramecium tetraurelia]|uniref:Uncharacterized protein n=1 Tax=Paramecium tetraurelia TaxID=5888 RepID=A0CU66_PARTE|nr:uncharacterized protein GSPATT00010532001 [Paramecium tetraurelia]CAK74333.1 unnamed protein product [Paramecium tetraurelia]|eukprot:XP_001441730.1 hypothetical protein (macronuclear) [Paramecium tetraurelia strain d4-2]